MATSEISVTTEHDEPRPEKPRRNAYQRNKDHRLRRLLTMETSLAKNIHKCNPQTDSPIWRLPQEIRDMIFPLVTAQYEDMSQAYEDYENWYRPGHRGPLRSDTSILRTCRRAWLETNGLPMQQAVHLFWHHTNIQDAKHDRLPGRWWQEFGSRLTHLNIENIQSIHLMFPVHNMHQVFERENSVANMVRYVKPKIFRVTNRYHDWPASDWRDGSYRTTVCERQARRQITMLPDACSVHVKKFQLALEVFPREWEGYAAFFGTIRRLKKKLEMTRHSYDADPVVSYLCVVDEPRSWRWRRRRSTNRFDENDKVTESKIELRVLELEWIRVCEVAESLLNTKANIITDAALHISSSHMFAQPSGVAQRKEYGTAQKMLSWQQRHVQQHSQKLHNVHEAQCRKLFTRQLVEFETGVSFSEYAPEESLLCSVED